MKISNSISIKEIKDTVSTIVNSCHPEKVILFGSYAEGNPAPDSDIDLLVIVKSAKSAWEISIDISLLLKHSFPMDIIVKKPDEVEKRIKMGDFFLQNIINTGTLLYERSC